MEKGEYNRRNYFLFGMSMLILFLLNFLINGWICEGPRVFYLDDMETVLLFQNSDFLSFVFTTSANKIRPVTYAFIGLILKCCSNCYEVIDELLLMLNFINSVIIFIVLYRMLKFQTKIERTAISLIGAGLFLISHFAYYNISEVWGIMEGIAIAFSIGLLFSLLRYIDSSKKKYYNIAVIMYALSLYTHERYFVLVFLFVIAIVFQNNINKRTKAMMLLPPFLLMVSFWLLRFFLFGDRMLDGTGGTAINESFNMMTVIQYAFSQIGYILGFNCGPAYLNGIDVKSVHWMINLLLGCRVLIIIFVCLCFIKRLIVNAEFRRMHLPVFVMLITFIALLIGSSSITIRVEMRWIYVSYAAFIILFFYMLSSLNVKTVVKSIFVLFFVFVSFVSELYYRDHYDNLYYWKTKDMAKALYCETVGSYGDDLRGKHIIIVSQSQFWADQTDKDWEDFFSPYVDSEGITVSYVANLNEVRAVADNNYIILVEDSQNKKYMDVTNEIKPYTISYGMYEDGWIEPECKLRFYGGDYKVIFSFFNPEELKGDERGKIFINGKEVVNFTIDGQWTDIELELTNDEDVYDIEIVLDYWVHENTGRSEDGRLSCILDIYTEE